MSEFIYNTIPYPSFTLPQTHPDRLATLGRLYGIETASPQRCRVLELGCGDGSNLLSFAYALPESEFVGVDLSEKHIAAADKTKIELNLSNVFFYCEDVMNLNQTRLGDYDFIIAHGLYSWVPDFVRKKVLQIYAECLKTNGVGYISYNALPGCRLRQMMFEMMKFHTDKIAAPLEQVKNAVTFLGFLSEAAEQNSLYQNLLKAEFAAAVERTSENIFHDDLAEINQPFYFHEFVKQIAPFKLQFLCEAEPSASNDGNLAPQIRQALQALSGGDVVKREQYLDFIKARRFRSTLVCRAETIINRQPEPEIVTKFFLSASVKPVSEKPDLLYRTKEKFVGRNNASFETDHPLTKIVLSELSRVWSSSISFVEATKIARQMLEIEPDFDFEAEKRQTALFLLAVFQAGFVKFHSYQAKFATVAGEFPQVSDFARWQARNCNGAAVTVTTLNGMNLKIEDKFIRQLLILSNGTRNRTKLAAEMTDISQDKNNLFESIEFNLKKFADSGLLIK
jgi:methyltransferase-like protein/SAM-dependent methyltransferase